MDEIKMLANYWEISDFPRKNSIIATRLGVGVGEKAILNSNI